LLKGIEPMPLARCVRAGALLVAALAALQCGQKPAGTSADQNAPMTEDEKMLYAVGAAVAANTLGSWKDEMSEQEVQLIVAGFRDGVLGKEARVSLEEYGPKLNEFLQQRAQARWTRQAEANRTAGTAYLEEAARAEGAVRTPSGLVYQDLVLGTGAVPQPASTVRVHYRGSLVDGTVFDDSHERNSPVVQRLDGFIAGWQEGLARMRAGGKARLVIPPELAYGDRPVGSIPPGSTLVFELELLDVQ